MAKKKTSGIVEGEEVLGKKKEQVKVIKTPNGYYREVPLGNGKVRKEFVVCE